jgi:O-antigen/teichoic acid export membrane protein
MIDRPGLLKAGVEKARRLASGEIARASAVSIAIRIFGLTLSFAQAVLTARLLGASGYGTVAVAMSIVQILATVSVFGFGGLAVREVSARIAAADRTGLAAFVRVAVLVVLAFSVIGSLILAMLAGSSGIVHPDYRSVLLIGAMLPVPVALIALFRGIAQGFARIALAQAPGEIVRPGAMVLVMGLAAILGVRLAPSHIMWTAVGAAIIAAIAGGAWLWVRELVALPRLNSIHGVAHQIAVALAFVGLDLTSILQGEINTILLGAVASAHDAGLFQPILRLTVVLTLAVQAAGMRYAPRIAELWEKGDRERIRLITKTFTWTTSLITLGVAVVTAATGPWLMWLFGPEFRQVAPLLWIVAVAQVFNAACGPVGTLLMMSGASGRALVGLVAGLVVNALVGILLIPAHGALGAVIAMVGGIFVWNFVMWLMVTKHHGFDPTIAGALKFGRE